MAEPTSSAGIIAVGVAGAGFTGLMAAFNGDAAVGALCGAVLFFIAAGEHPIKSRLALFLVSLVMGYLFAPVVAAAQFDVFGVSIGPLELPAPAAFVSAAFVVSATLTALKLRGKQASPSP